MLRVLTLSTLFPDVTRPVFGPFIERQTIELGAHPDVDLRVVAPIGLPFWPLTLLDHYKVFARVPVRENWKGLDVYRPRFIHWPGTKGRFDAESMARSLLPLLRAIRQEFAFDVIDTEYFFPDGPAAVRLGEALGVPVSIKARGSDIHYWGAQAATAGQVIDAGLRASGLLAVSSALKQDMIALGMPENRIKVHYTGVDQSVFQIADQVAAKAALGVSGPLIVSIGTLNERKGHNHVIDAMARLPSATLVIVGNGPIRSRLEAQAVRVGVADRVRFLGSRPQAELPAIFAAADVMALLSSAEGLANVWVEALACGTPLVIADAGGAREVLDRPEAGRIVDRSVDAVTEGIASILASPPDRQIVRKAAERFTWEANTAALFAHLSDLAL
jgi:teichuronic acid biosynthesis glycosyltransferase TuaC